MSITFLLIATNVLFYFISMSNKQLLDKTVMWPYYVKRNNEYHRFITSGFIHADLMHLFFNMFTLYFFGKNVEAVFHIGQLGGTASFIGLYLGGLIASDIPGYFRHQDNYSYRSLGASGAVSGVVFAAVVFSPWSSIYLYGALKISAALYAVLFVMYCMYMDKRGGDNVNHNAHLWGALYGLAFTIILIAVLQKDLFGIILEELKHPSLFGR